MGEANGERERETDDIYTSYINAHNMRMNKEHKLNLTSLQLRRAKNTDADSSLPGSK